MKTCKKGLHQYDEHLKKCPECYKVVIEAYRQTEKYKAVAKASQKAYHQRNKEKRNLQIAEWASIPENKARKKETDKAWAARNRERINYSQRKNRLENKDAINAKEREKYAADPQKGRDEQKRYAEKHVEQMRKRRLLLYSINPETGRERSRKWRKINPEKAKKTNADQRIELKPSYLSAILGMKASEIRKYPELLEAKREHLKAFRQLRQQQQQQTTKV